MKVVTPYRCDYCPTDKREANHWWMRHRGTIEFVLLPWNDQIAGQETATAEPVYEHICSEACAVKALSKWLGGGK